jgi:hypothetical protein
MLGTSVAGLIGLGIMFIAESEGKQFLVIYFMWCLAIHCLDGQISVSIASNWDYLSLLQ